MFHNILITLSIKGLICLDYHLEEALQMAQKIDVEGDRTLGVLTKIDIMDRGTDARNKLLGNEVPLKLGYVGVKCRSQDDINNKLPVKISLEVTS